MSGPASNVSRSKCDTASNDGHGKPCPYLTVTPDGIVLMLHIQPRAKREGVVGLHGEALKIALKAPPVDGAANEALLAFLAKTLGIAKSECVLLSGETSRSKRVRVPGECLEKVVPLIAESGR